MIFEKIGKTTDRQELINEMQRLANIKTEQKKSEGFDFYKDFMSKKKSWEKRNKKKLSEGFDLYQEFLKKKKEDDIKVKGMKKRKRGINEGKMSDLEIDLQDVLIDLDNGIKANKLYSKIKDILKKIFSEKTSNELKKHIVKTVVSELDKVFKKYPKLKKKILNIEIK